MKQIMQCIEDWHKKYPYRINVPYGKFELFTEDVLERFNLYQRDEDFSIKLGATTITSTTTETGWVRAVEVFSNDEVGVELEYAIYEDTDCQSITIFCMFVRHYEEIKQLLNF